MNPLYVTFATALISSLASAIVASCVALIRSKSNKTQKQLDKERKEMDALKLGMRALLWEQLNEIYARAKQQNGLTVVERHNLTNIYEAYHALGGNGTGTRLHDEAMEFPVITD
jgi:Na+-transporting NADH:ubiquinone oxidoreductase subunit NqrC